MKSSLRAYYAIAQWKVSAKKMETVDSLNH